MEIIIPNLTMAQKIVGTSVDDARGSIRNIKDITLTEKCLIQEKKFKKRKTVIKLLSAKIKKLREN